MWHEAWLITTAVGLVLLNTIGLALTLLQGPGPWLMLAVTGGYAWWRWDGPGPSLGWWTLGIVLALAVLGELIETLAASVGAKAVGGSKRGAMLALIGGIVGAIAGTVLLTIPVAGTLIGAAIGAGGFAMLGDRWAGRNWSLAWKGGKAAATGKLIGALGKLITAALMWLAVVIGLCV